jgi:hypothetical protein
VWRTVSDIQALAKGSEFFIDGNVGWSVAANQPDDKANVVLLGFFESVELIVLSIITNLCAHVF